MTPCLPSGVLAILLHLHSVAGLTASNRNGENAELLLIRIKEIYFKIENI